LSDEVESNPSPNLE